MKDTSYLFVYGTLRRDAGTEMSLFLGGSARFVGSARTTGRLYQLGSFPGLILSQDSRNFVIGEVHELGDPAVTWPVLDAYEGDEFERRIVPVRLDDGGKLDAWAYVYESDTSGKPRILSGDFLQPLNC